LSDDLVSAGVLLLLVLDPFGNIPIVLSALARVPRERHRLVVARECLFAYVILLAFMAGGTAFLDLMRLSQPALSIAGGIVLFLIALRMIFPTPEGVFGDAPGAEPFLVPIAVPAIAGPSALAIVMLMASREPSRIGVWVLALSAAMAVTLFVLLGAQRLQRALGERVVRAVERLTGLVLTAVAVQMLLDGIAAFVRQSGGF